MMSDRKKVLTRYSVFLGHILRVDRALDGNSDGKVGIIRAEVIARGHTCTRLGHVDHPFSRCRIVIGKEHVETDLQRWSVKSHESFFGGAFARECTIYYLRRRSCGIS
jgi:hypothetical protein